MGNSQSNASYTINCRWNHHQIPVNVDASTTVGDLKQRLLELTHVPVENQKLIGLVPAGTPFNDATKLEACSSLRERKGFIMMGTACPLPFSTPQYEDPCVVAATKIGAIRTRIDALVEGWALLYSAARAWLAQAGSTSPLECGCASPGACEGHPTTPHQPAGTDPAAATTPSSSGSGSGGISPANAGSSETPATTADTPATTAAAIAALRELPFLRRGARLEYMCSQAVELLTREMIALDGVTVGDNTDLRAQRKAEVVRIQSVLDGADSIKADMSEWVAALRPVTGS
eukprot:CAMPEP_0177634314 /NCGR_PEP_ID=MMETSP0447-20121125/3301_1 /TAXON_ID=0 /ORGANISM="Stygamoeba regulata, Strain BSH-02190019" /LENGTH=288 /DNA_ID=CAMNT_0019136025 /DNA_START=293 /DNA_END=1159 /DNA_ORIENTATION=-